MIGRGFFPIIQLRISVRIGRGAKGLFSTREDSDAILYYLLGVLRLVFHGEPFLKMLQQLHFIEKTQFPMVDTACARGLSVTANLSPRAF